jgi:hypothetical protein
VGKSTASCCFIIHEAFHNNSELLYVMRFFQITLICCLEQEYRVGAEESTVATNKVATGVTGCLMRSAES